MKILQINNQHYLKGGAHRVYFETANLLKEKGHEVFFFSMKEGLSKHDDNEQFFPKSIDHRKSDIVTKFKSIRGFLNNKEAAKNLENYIQRIKPDVAHVHLFMGALTSSVLSVLKDNNIPIVHTVHDYRLICPSYLFLDGDGKICERCKSGRFLNCVVNRCSGKNISHSAILAVDAYYRKYFESPNEYIDKYIFVSKFIQDKHSEYLYDIGSNSVVLHNFISNLDEIWPNNNKGDYFLYLGRLSREKGVVTLIDAAVKTGVNLKIVGDCSTFDKSLAQRSPNIEFLGFKQFPELWDIIRNAGFVVVPSEWYENNPLSVIESYACGKPVIGSNIGGIPEILKHGITGYLFQPGDEDNLIQVLKKANSVSKSDYESLSKNSRRFAERAFNPTSHYTELIKIYNEVIR
jgi:glycosyltransferase involved in cell wall biosynthesis